MSAIHKQILAVMGDIRAIGKTKKTDGTDGFQFRGIDDLYNALNPLFQKHRIFCTTEVLSHHTNGMGRTLIEAKFNFFAEDGSSVSSTTRGEIQDKGDKGTASALSIAHRIALTQMLLIPTEDGTPFMTPHLFAKAKDRIKGGDFQLYFKIEGMYRMTNEQKSELQKLISIPIPGKK